MDAPEEHPDILAGDLRNLEALNRFFGGRSVVKRWIGRILREHPPDHPLSVLDIGSGAGDLCRCLVETCREAKREVRVYSLDFHGPVQEYARAGSAQFPEIRFLRGDARQIPLRDDSVNAAFCTLALHHFEEDGARTVLSEMNRVSRECVVVSDLTRGETAYAAVWLATRFMSNPMTRKDGPLSVKRAFTRKELLTLAQEAGWAEPRLYRERWFRASVVGRRL